MNNIFHLNSPIVNPLQLLDSSLVPSFPTPRFHLNYFRASCRHQDISPLNALARYGQKTSISLSYLSLTSIRFYVLKFLTLHFFGVIKAILQIDKLLK